VGDRQLAENAALRSEIEELEDLIEERHGREVRVADRASPAPGDAFRIARSSSEAHLPFRLAAHAVAAVAEDVLRRERDRGVPSERMAAGPLAVARVVVEGAVRLPAVEALRRGAHLKQPIGGTREQLSADLSRNRGGGGRQVLGALDDPVDEGMELAQAI